MLTPRSSTCGRRWNVCHDLLKPTHPERQTGNGRDEEATPGEQVPAGRTPQAAAVLRPNGKEGDGTMKDFILVMGALGASFYAGLAHWTPTPKDTKPPAFNLDRKPEPPVVEPQ